MLAFTHRVMELRLQTTWTLTGQTTEPNRGNRTPFFDSGQPGFLKLDILEPRTFEKGILKKVKPTDD